MKVDGASPKRWFNKGAMINQYIGVAPSTFQGVDGYFEGYMYNSTTTDSHVTLKIQFFLTHGISTVLIQ